MTIDGDADLLRQLLLNLIDNAAQHTIDGGMITVAWRVDGGVHITRPRRRRRDRRGRLAPVFEPFDRGDTSRAAGAAQRASGWPSPRRLLTPTAPR